jgi:hypothetical protein
VEESFHVLDGEFAFSVGEQVTAAGAGTYVLVPRGTRHKIAAGAGGGRLFALMVRGGLEEKFFELGDLPPDGITDPAVRTAISPSTTPSRRRHRPPHRRHPIARGMQGGSGRLAAW